MNIKNAYFLLILLLLSSAIVHAEECITQSTKSKDQPAEWLIMIFMAADNNLNYFAVKNINQMKQIGSSDKVKIVVQVNEPGASRATQRLFIGKGALTQLAGSHSNKKLNTGDPQTVINFVTETYAQFPAQKICLIFWDHGTGYIDPVSARVFNIQEQFHLNTTDMMLEITRHEDLVESPAAREQRGLCFDETHGSYLSNQKIDYALKTICSKIGRKFDIIGMDACLMQMLEFGALLQPYARLMVGSQELELGEGWNYKYILGPLQDKSFSAHELAKHIVQCYQKTYAPITYDFTLSAVDLERLPQLTNSIGQVASLLTQCLQNQTNNSVYQTLARCRSKQACLCFSEQSYLDLGNLCTNLKNSISQFKTKKRSFVDDLAQKLSEAQGILNSVVIENTHGKNLANASGLSIYFPERRLHSSYPQAPFAQVNAWPNFVIQYLKNVRSTETSLAPALAN